MAASRRLAWWLAVAVGGALGTVARYEVTLALPAERKHLPWAILLVNVVGCTVVGAVTATVHARPGVPDWLRPLVVVGLCGGLTTFSTWMVADVLLVRDGAVGVALLDVVGSLLAGFLAVAIAFRVAARLLGSPREVDLDLREAD